MENQINSISLKKNSTPSTVNSIKSCLDDLTDEMKGIQMQFQEHINNNPSSQLLEDMLETELKLLDKLQHLNMKCIIHKK